MPQRGRRAPYCKFFVYEGKTSCEYGCQYEFCPRLGKQPIKVVCHKYARGYCRFGDQCTYGVHERPNAWHESRGSAGGTGGTATGGPNGSYGSSSGRAGGAGGSATGGPAGAKVVALAEAQENMIQAAIQVLNLDPRCDTWDEKAKKEHLARYQRVLHPDKVAGTVFQPVFNEIEKYVHHKMGK